MRYAGGCKQGLSVPLPCHSSFMGSNSLEFDPLESNRKNLCGYLIRLGAQSLWFYKVFFIIIILELLPF